MANVPDTYSDVLMFATGRACSLVAFFTVECGYKLPPKSSTQVSSRGRVGRRVERRDFGGGINHWKGKGLRVMVKRRGHFSKAVLM